MDTVYIFLTCVGVILLGLLSIRIPLTGLIGVLFGIVILLPEIIATADATFRGFMIVSLVSTLILFAIGYTKR